MPGPSSAAEHIMGNFDRSTEDYSESVSLEPPPQPHAGVYSGISHTEVKYKNI